MKLNYHKKIMYDYKYGNNSILCKETEKIKKAEKESDRSEFFARKGKNKKGGCFVEILSNRFLRHIVNQ